MASDHQEPSRRKHRRNSDNESVEPSKRHHHRHHHRRHRHRRNRKHEEEIGTKHDAEEKSQPSSPPPSAVVVSNGNWRPDYDMEEGEILEEDEAFVVGENKKLDSSDVESGEIKAAVAITNKNMEGVRVELDGSSLSFDSQNVEKVGSGLMILGVGNGDDGFTANATVDRKVNLSDDTKICDEVDLQRNSSVEHHGNEDISKEENNQPLRSSSPEGLEKRQALCVDENEFRGRNKLSSSENAGKRPKSLGISPSHDRHHEEDRRTNRSRSHERVREGSRPQSILQEALQSHQRDAAYQTERKLTKDSDDEAFGRHHRDYRHGSRDLLRDKERERSSSYSRHTARVDKHQSPEAWDRDRERSRETWDGEREWREMDRDRKREKEWEKVRERAWERDRNRERVREGERKRERDRDRSREKEYDRFSRNRKHYDVDVGYGDRDRHNDYRHRRLDETEHMDRSRKNDSEKVHSTKVDDSERDTEKLRRDEVEQENYQERIVLQLAEHEEEEIDRIKEESRKRRQAILEKFKTQKSQQKHEPNLQEAVKECAEQPSVSVPLPNVAAQTQTGRNEAADIFLVDTSFSVGKSPEQIEPHALKISGSGALGEGTPKSERSDDMFRDDIFGDSPAGVRKPGRGDGLPIDRSGLHDNWDDAEGYYSYRFGEILDCRYEVIAAHGKGVFSSVVRAKDLRAGSGDPEEVAIKIIRSNDTMYKTGLEELVILKKLVGADQEDRRHCVRFLSSFKYRNHLCLVFESLHMNLREVLKKFGRNIGLKLTAIRTYAKQLFIALKHLRNCGVLHCDIKPDNMLVNDAKNVLKLCDFGNAMFAGKNEITPYLVSRFYRAPEIILGLPYDHPMDMWSVGCCLFELYTGKVLFPGPSNNDMLRLHMELKGPFPKKMLRKGAFIDQHFDQDLNFLATEEDPVTKKAIKRLILNIKPKDIGTIVLGSAGEDPKMLANFKDLLEKIFMLDPDKRITVSQALSHPFITALNTVPVLVEVYRDDDIWLGGLFLGDSFSGLCSIDICQCYEATIQCFRCLKKGTLGEVEVYFRYMSPYFYNCWSNAFIRLLEEFVLAPPSA